jgi:alpha-galactosidase
MKYFVLYLFTFFFTYATAQNRDIKNDWYKLTIPQKNITFLTYTIIKSGKKASIDLPSFEINGSKKSSPLKELHQVGEAKVLANGVNEYLYEGEYVLNKGLYLEIVLQMAKDNPIIRYHYRLKSNNNDYKLTKRDNKDNITYGVFNLNASKHKEIRLSEFNERFHATHKTEYAINESAYSNESTFMGPLTLAYDDKNTFLMGYEHGSVYPDRFFEYKLNNLKQSSLHAVKGNYLTNQPCNGWSSVWFEFGGVAGSEDLLASQYRSFILTNISENVESRKPYVFYNTWGRQERTAWRGEKYLSSMNLETTLKEIDRAHELGIEVYVLDAGWYIKTGDWELNKKFFPDDLKQVKQKLDQYGMKLGLWFNPTVAALSSKMLANNIQNQMTNDGKVGDPFPIWETENSVGLCLVSSYWKDFADKLIELVDKYGVSYFKWDAIGQYGCNDPNHYHGTKDHSLDERSIRYAYLQPGYMTNVINRVQAKAPETIFDFDITEDGRCVGLQFLTAGKYFIINNGPYYHSFDLAEKWKSVNPNNNPNVFVAPGPARGWFTRSVLDYDKWLPSVLFLTHYQPDEPRNSQVINMASLILGQNGIWGEILSASDEGVKYMSKTLSQYKKVRDDITKAKIIITGEQGGSPEIYEKINPKTGKGCVVIFANSGGTYEYITENTTTQKWSESEGVQVKKDKKGRAVIKVQFSEPSAKIIFFGAE